MKKRVLIISIIVVLCGLLVFAVLFFLKSSEKTSKALDAVPGNPALIIETNSFNSFFEKLSLDYVISYEIQKFFQVNSSNSLAHCFDSISKSDFFKEVKKLGFKIKLDTNGINTKIIKDLISKNLIDFISLDFKAPKKKFKIVTQKSSYESMINTIKHLLSINFNFEVRTTVNADLLDFEDINKIIEKLYCLGYNSIYYIQNFLQTSTNIGNITQKKILEKDKIRDDLLKIEFRN